MVDIFEEVDEALRKERLARVWREYGVVIIAGLSMLVIFTAFFSYMNFYNLRQNESATHDLLALLESVESVDPLGVESSLAHSESLLTFAEKTRFGHAMIARFHAAGVLLQASNTESREQAKSLRMQAMDIYQEIAQNNRYPRIFRDLAVLARIRAGLDHAQDDEISSFVRSLTLIMEDPRNPWRFHARLYLAGVYAYGKQDMESAVRILQPLIDMREGKESPVAPMSLLKRAQALHNVYHAQIEWAD